MIHLARKIALLVALSSIAFAASAHADTRVSFASGVDYSSGDFGGDDDTEVISIPLRARLTTGNWSFRVSAPYLSITGPADITDVSEGGGDGDGGSGANGATTRIGTVRGIGDTTLAVDYRFRRLRGTDAYIELGARARLPTGDEKKGLGSGTTDYTLLTELGVSGDRGGAHVIVGRRLRGDRPGVDRQDGWQAEIGGWLPASDRTNIGASASWRQPSIEGNEEASEIGAYVSRRMSENLRISINASAGLSDASPDYSTGIRFTWRSEDLNSTSHP